MKATVYKSLEEALNNLLPDDAEHILARHSLNKGEVIEEHFHPYVDEYVILSNGSVRIIYGGRQVEDVHANNQTTVVKLPSGKYHGLTALTDITYLVLRTGNDEIIYR